LGFASRASFEVGGGIRIEPVARLRTESGRSGRRGRARAADGRSDDTLVVVLRKHDAQPAPRIASKQV
jgi:hypothetical protein